MRIGMVLEYPFPPDIRVEKEIRALQTGGHEVVLLCGHKGDQPIEDWYGNTRVVRFSRGSFDNIVSRGINLLCYRITGRNRPWQGAIMRFVRERNIQALHVHDLPLVLTGLAVARKAGIPVIFDMHEVFSAMIRYSLSTLPDSRRGIKWSVYFSLFSPQWWERVEQRSVSQVDRIVVVVEESKELLVRMGVDSGKIFVALNATDIDDFLTLPGQFEKPSMYQNDFLVGYVGGVDNPNRGLDNLVRAWPLLLKRIPNARLLIVGDGIFRPVLEDLVHGLDLTEQVTFVGRVPFEEVSAYIRAFDIAVVPHVINEHTNHTIPHKLFQYIALGKLVVASNIAPIRRILQDTGAGIIVEDWSPQGFANAIEQAHTLLRSGRHDPESQVIVLKAKYGFDRMTEPLLELYEGLVVY